MRLLITGQSGFIGQHVKLFLTERKESFQTPNLLSHYSRVDLDINSRNACQSLLQSSFPTDVLHLAWATTSQLNYDRSDVHYKFADSTMRFAADLANHGIVNWIVGTGLETEKTSALSPYGDAKLKLKAEVLSSNNQLIRWISMPYVFSLFHRRPRIIEACLEGSTLRSSNSEHDYLEIRDVAYQISKILMSSSDQLNSVSSNQKISNSNFCRSVREAMNFQHAGECSCRGNLDYNPLQLDTHFTSLILR